MGNVFGSKQCPRPRRGGAAIQLLRLLQSRISQEIFFPSKRIIGIGGSNLLYFIINCNRFLLYDYSVKIFYESCKYIFNNYNKRFYLIIFRKGIVCFFLGKNNKQNKVITSHFLQIT